MIAEQRNRSQNEHKLHFNNQKWTTSLEQFSCVFDGKKAKPIRRFLNLTFSLNAVRSEAQIVEWRMDSGTEILGIGKTRISQKEELYFSANIANTIQLNNRHHRETIKQSQICFEVHQFCQQKVFFFGGGINKKQNIWNSMLRKMRWRGGCKTGPHPATVNLRMAK